MGCVPDRTLAKYRTFQNEDQSPNNREQQNSMHMSSRLSIHSNDLNISYRPFGKVYRSCAKRGSNSPVKLAPLLRAERKKPNYFSLEKTQWNNMEQQVITVKRQRNQNEAKGGHAKGAIIEIPHREHVITSVETPSESAKTSFLSKMEKHPSNFFISNNENDFDLLFRSNLNEKVEESTASVNHLEEPASKEQIKS